eukprot:6433440-Alexandrium_andersonii.AAC.1
MRRQLTSSPSLSKTSNDGPRFATWSSLSTSEGVGDAPCLAGGGVLPPCPFERIEDARRRSEESGDKHDLDKTTLHRSEVSAPAVGGGAGPPDQLSLPPKELGSFDEVSKRAGGPDREPLRRGAMALESLLR